MFKYNVEKSKDSVLEIEWTWPDSWMSLFRYLDIETKRSKTLRLDEKSTKENIK